MIGTVISFKGSFGFIRPDGEPRDVFVYEADIDTPGWRTLSPQQRVTFELADSPKGPKAVGVKPVESVPIR